MNVADVALQVTWADDLEKDGELFTAVQGANKVLEEELGRSVGLVTANWRPVRDNRNRSLLELTLTDVFTKSQVAERFAPDDLRNTAQVGSRFHRLWGNLLQARSEAQIQRLRELASEEGE